MDNRPIAALVALAIAAAPAGAATLYKSVSPTGVIEFSDTPPSERSMLVESRPIESVGSVSSSSSGNLINVSLDADESITRANAQVDLAEHALALARRSMWSELEGVRLSSHRATASDVERVEFYKRGVLAARQNLMDVLRTRSSPTVLASR
jgi:hypothetical protein